MNGISSPDGAAMDKTASNVSEPASINSNRDAKNQISASDDEVG